MGRDSSYYPPPLCFCACVANKEVGAQFVRKTAQFARSCAVSGRRMKIGGTPPVAIGIVRKRLKRKGLLERRRAKSAEAIENKAVE